MYCAHRLLSELTRILCKRRIIFCGSPSNRAEHQHNRRAKSRFVSVRKSYTKQKSRTFILHGGQLLTGLSLQASQARSRILALGHRNCRRDTLSFTQSGLQTDSIPGQARNTTVQVWTVVEGFGIRSEFSQTCCAANNFRDHEVLLPLVQRGRRLS